jgi:RimJ/RimL family protein N-acetyltransferase
VPFVPGDFEPPAGLVNARFVLEPLGPEHNEADYDAWSSSIDHIRATPGFEGSSWPREMTLEENYRDLARHANDFATRAGFTYTVLDPESGEVIGCVYVYPDKHGGHDAAVESWVRVTRAELDAPLRDAVSRWLAEAWPFERVAYAAAD